MLRLSPIALFSVVFLIAANSPQSATAQQWGHSSGPDLRHEMFVDKRGRRFLVDPETGEVLGRANRHARFTRRDKIRAQRAWRRANRNVGRQQRRRATWESDRDRLFDDEFATREPRHYDGDAVRRSRRTYDEYDTDDMPVGSTRRFDQRRAEPAPELSRQHQRQFARLPDAQPPVSRIRPIDGVSKPELTNRQIAKLQVVLDREGFSPGVVDGLWGSNLARALVARKKANPKSVDLTNLAALEAGASRSGGAAFTTYRLTEVDLAGPFVAQVPVDYAKKARLSALSFTSVVEMLAERFHMSEALLRELNPGQNFGRAGTRLKVAAPGNKVTKKVHYVVADKGRKQLQAFDRNGKLVASYPATIGSASTPSPSGTHSVARIALNPEYTYNPRKNFQQGDNDKVLRIPPGPNGPVGSVWIALSKPSYGIHGTPNPTTIGKTSSHGCIRLTNWDAQELASLVREGVTVQFVE